MFFVVVVVVIRVLCSFIKKVQNRYLLVPPILSMLYFYINFVFPFVT